MIVRSCSSSGNLPESILLEAEKILTQLLSLWHRVQMSTDVSIIISCFSLCKFYKIYKNRIFVEAQMINRIHGIIVFVIVNRRGWRRNIGLIYIVFFHWLLYLCLRCLSSRRPSPKSFIFLGHNILDAKFPTKIVKVFLMFW